MKAILNKSNPLELNALFIQPTRWCGLDCDGCYVKEHSGGEDGFHLSPKALSMLFNAFYFNQTHSIQGHEYQCWANQITISMDDFPKNPRRKFHMFDVFTKIMDALHQGREDGYDKPEVHMTFNTPGTLNSYVGGDGIAAVGVFAALDMVSFSHIPGNQLELMRGMKNTLGNKTVINYNHLVPGNVTSLNIDRHVKRMTEIGEVVDHIYMVIFKTPVTRLQPTHLMQIGQESRMSSDIAYINTMMERLPESVRRKISVDGCLEDTIKYSRTGFGCSSNVSRVQVWPDGSVTGCPYAFSSDGAEGRTLENILGNIRRARKQYDFKEKCHLPKVYDSITNRQRSSRA